MRTILLAAVVVTSGAAGADEPRPVSDRAKKQVAAELVDKLGSRDFKEREAAEKKLLELGGVVREVVEAGLKSDSAEVATRCERLLPKLRETDLLAPDAAAWKRFAEVAGDTDGARGLFRDMAKVPDLAEWLEKVEADPTATEQAYQWAVNRAAVTPPRRASWLGWRPDEPPNPWSTFMLYVGGFAGSGRVTGPTVPEGSGANGFAMIHGLRPYPHSGWTRGEDGKPVPLPPGPVEEARKLFARWFATQTAEAALTVGVPVATAAAMPETAPALKRAAGAKGLPVKLRLHAASGAVRFGADVSAELSPLLADNAEIARGNIPLKAEPEETDRVTAQARDAAAGLAVRSRGFDPADFGFAHFRRLADATDWNGRPVSDIDHRYGFTDDASRERAHATVAAFLALKPVRAKMGKVVVPPADPPEVLAVIAQIERDVRAETVPSARAIFIRASELHRFYPGHNPRIAYEAVRIVLDTGPTSEAEFVEAVGRVRQSRPDPLNYVSILRRLSDRELNGNGKFALHRANAAEHLLDAYAELLKLELPGKRPEVPKVTPPGPDATARERAEFIVANAARRDARYVGDLLDARDAVVAQMVDLYKPDPTKPGRDDQGPDELRKLAEKKLSKEAVGGLMKQVE